MSLDASGDEQAQMVSNARSNSSSSSPVKEASMSLEDFFISALDEVYLHLTPSFIASLCSVSLALNVEMPRIARLVQRRINDKYYSGRASMMRRNILSITTRSNSQQHSRLSTPCYLAHEMTTNKIFLLAGDKDGKECADVHSFEVARGSFSSSSSSSSSSSHKLVWQKHPNLINTESFSCFSAVRFRDKILIAGGYHHHAKARQGKNKAFGCLVSYSTIGGSAKEEQKEGNLPTFRTYMSLASSQVYGSDAVFMTGGYVITQKPRTKIYSRDAFKVMLSSSNDGALFESLPKMITGRCEHASVISGNCLIIAGGEDASDSTTTTCEVLRVDRGNEAIWQVSGSLCEPRSRFYMCVVQDELYAIGGTNNGRLSVEKRNSISFAWTKIAEIDEDRQGASFAGLGGSSIYIFGSNDARHAGTWNRFCCATRTFASESIPVSERAMPRTHAFGAAIEAGFPNITW